MEDPPSFLSSFFGVFMKGKSSRKSEPSEGNEKQTRSRNPVALPEEILRQFSLDQIRAATCNFRRDLIIGHGAFGTVYKAFFDDGNLVVAVKRLKPDFERGAGYEEFRTELLMHCQLHHSNLVPLLGFCFDKGEMILVYEYMGKGKLSDHLYGSRYDPLPWKLRLEICIGALLSDFRASKLRPRSNSKSKTSERIDKLVQGNYGYLDPEYLETAQLEEKCDVYSFGVVLFEVLCARRPFGVHDDGNMTFLVDMACQPIREGTIYDIIDPYLKGRIAPKCFKMFVYIAGSCTSVVGDERPEMGEVEVMLERALELQEKADSDPVHMVNIPMKKHPLVPLSLPTNAEQRVML
ncbi:hypothetical protein V6N12_023021 [Hibiscus sabdariffa]|uniref:Protein kinase domain-containing protein n=1 Tax=Hibiscus sabdariffa TaxID=183260 RepID=A0ABR2FWL5_9ROSI